MELELYVYGSNDKSAASIIILFSYGVTDNNVRLNRSKIEEREQIKPKIIFKDNADTGK